MKALAFCRAALAVLADLTLAFADLAAVPALATEVVVAVVVVTVEAAAEPLVVAA
ncbi:hypothetical protein [Nonomuraea sp. NPDC050783]|uniref:hypothetical protein n=1 Tax=Nonomuraea sp. NPDC050783 TaxID=3154634 RepID=UPI003466FD87